MKFHVFWIQLLTCEFAWTQPYLWIITNFNSVNKEILQFIGKIGLNGYIIKNIVMLKEYIDDPEHVLKCWQINISLQFHCEKY